MVGDKPPPRLTTRTPTAYVNSTDSEEDYFPDSVVLDLTDDSAVTAPPGLYGLFVSDPGGSHGLVSYVYATIDEQQFEYSVGNGMCTNYRTV